MKPTLLKPLVSTMVLLASFTSARAADVTPAEIKATAEEGSSVLSQVPWHGLQYK